MTVDDALTLMPFDMVVYNGCFVRVRQVSADGMTVEGFAKTGNVTVPTSTVTLAYRRADVPRSVHLGYLTPEQAERLHVPFNPKRRPWTPHYSKENSYE